VAYVLAQYRKSIFLMRVNGKTYKVKEEVVFNGREKTYRVISMELEEIKEGGEI